MIKLIIKKITSKFFGNKQKPSSKDFESILKKYSKLKREVFFIQIGSNDGIANDPIAEFIKYNNWKGIMIEPIKYLFEKLKITHGDNNNLILLNAAVSQNDGVAIIYKVDEAYYNELPSWSNQLASFRKDIIESHESQIPGISSKIVQEEVATYCINTIVDMNKIDNVDFIHIDTEGYDYEVLKLIDFNRISPEIILYECKHLNIDDFNSSIHLLSSANYNCYSDNYDTLCIRKDVVKKINFNKNLIIENQ